MVHTIPTEFEVLDERARDVERLRVDFENHAGVVVAGQDDWVLRTGELLGHAPLRGRRRRDGA